MITGGLRARRPWREFLSGLDRIGQVWNGVRMRVYDFDSLLVWCTHGAGIDGLVSNW